MMLRLQKMQSPGSARRSDTSICYVCNAPLSGHLRVRCCQCRNYACNNCVFYEDGKKLGIDSHNIATASESASSGWSFWRPRSSDTDSGFLSLGWSHFRRSSSLAPQRDSEHNDVRGSVSSLATNFGSSNSVPLCKVCNEAKELWKRSGAWFYKSLPKVDSFDATISTNDDGWTRVQPTTAARLISNENENTSELVPTRKTSLSKPIPLPPSSLGGNGIRKSSHPAGVPLKEEDTNKNSQPRTDPMDLEHAPFGVIYFTLYLDTIRRQMHITLHKARNLVAMDSNGLSDPYVVITIAPDHKERTKTIPQTLNPIWNETFMLDLCEMMQFTDRTLRLAVMDEDMFGSDWLGEYHIPMVEISANRMSDYIVPLAPRKFSITPEDAHLETSHRGKIHLGLQYMEECKQLRVDVIKCAELAAMDPNGSSDPFVKFIYDAHLRTLEVTVWDFDRGPVNDFIGGLTLGSGAKAERREVWMAVFRPPYRRIEAWFQLSSRTDSSSVVPRRPSNYDEIMTAEDCLMAHQTSATPGIRD
ncbi:hypothetical protein Ciccas_002725 [Cichlidogyrus casuarinus]|uniref:C2 domain-containing protein n=1 Tax=Cichlidogyrus casuarinus TaxID=1844966 RepID=A0ABD2QGE2_9PLAT